MVVKQSVACFIGAKMSSGGTNILQHLQLLFITYLEAPQLNRIICLVTTEKTLKNDFKMQSI